LNLSSAPAGKVIVGGVELLLAVTMSMVPADGGAARLAPGLALMPLTFGNRSCQGWEARWREGIIK
jgi:hypothetical protein